MGCNSHQGAAPGSEAEQYVVQTVVCRLAIGHRNTSLVEYLSVKEIEKHQQRMEPKELHIMFVVYYCDFEN